MMTAAGGDKNCSIHGVPERELKKKQDIPRNLLSRAYERFVRIRGRPREIALGFALCIFIGMLPTMGIQMPIAVFFAALLKWSKISPAFGVWITNPFTSPFIYGLTYMVVPGCWDLRP